MARNVDIHMQSISNISSPSGPRRPDRERARFWNESWRLARILIPLLLILGYLFFLAFTHLQRQPPHTHNITDAQPPAHQPRPSINPPTQAGSTPPAPAPAPPSPSPSPSRPPPPPPKPSSSIISPSPPPPPPPPSGDNATSSTTPPPPPADSTSNDTTPPSGDQAASPPSQLASISSTSATISSDQLITPPVSPSSASPATARATAPRRLLMQSASGQQHTPAPPVLQQLDISAVPANFRSSRRTQVNVVVAQDDSGNFRSINAALETIPHDYQGRYTIYIKAGIYNEVLFIKPSLKNVSLVGAGMGRTIITGDRGVGSGLFNTLTSAIVHVAGDGFFARGITFRNTAGPRGWQAVAMLANADMMVFYKCSFEGYQDTLWAFAGRQFYRECTISGTVDFIFGNAAAVFQNCKLVARLPLKGQQNAYTAQGRAHPNEETGFVFHNCTLTGEDVLLRNIAPFQVFTYLGRPWQDFSRVIFLQCYMDALVHPQGWLAWNTSNPFTSTLHYAEFANRGPGSPTDKRVANWQGVHRSMTLAEASHFTVRNFIQGDTWLPSFQVAFQLTLIP